MWGTTFLAKRDEDKVALTIFISRQYAEDVEEYLNRNYLEKILEFKEASRLFDLLYNEAADLIHQTPDTFLDALADLRTILDFIVSLDSDLLLLETLKLRGFEIEPIEGEKLEEKINELQQQGYKIIEEV